VRRPKCWHGKGFVLRVPRKSLFAIMVNRSLLGMRPMTAWSIESDWGPAEKVNVFSSTLVML
jgi:hypothetical protein